MDNPTSLEVHPAPHPKLEVHRAGFSLDHAYLEQCWTPVLGPSSVLLLRRMTALWREAAPATVDVAELGAQLGLGHGGSKHSPIARTIERVVRFRFASWSAPGVLDVYTEVSPLPPRQLERVPRWCVDRHEELLSRHLAELGRHAGVVRPAAPASPFRVTDAAERMSRQLNEFALARMATPDTGLSR
jgi:hypothetical protein